MTGKEATALRTKLLDMRASLVERLAHRLDGGNLALLGTVAAAIAAVERAGADGAEPAQHVAVIDRPGEPIEIMLLSSAAGQIAAALDPPQAIELAGELIAAALPRLARVSR